MACGLNNIEHTRGDRPDLWGQWLADAWMIRVDRGTGYRRTTADAARAFIEQHGPNASIAYWPQLGMIHAELAP